MAEKTVTNAKGLDIGTSRIVLATQHNGDIQYASQLNAFVSLPYSKVTERMLERENIPHRVEKSEILAYGNRVEEFANLLGGDTRRPMRTGLLNPHEPKSLQMMELALREMCGEGSQGQKVCFSIPAAPAGNESDLIYHERTIKQILENLGYQAISLNEGLAVIFAELEEANFTGLGISFGGGMCNVCVSYLGLPALAFSTVRAGDYIDRSASSVTGETPSTVRLYKEQKFSLNGLSSQSIDQALSIYYKDVIETAVSGIGKALSETKKLPKFDRPVRIAVSGGSTAASGFREEFEEAIGKLELPIEIAEVRVAKDCFNTTARGTLMAAMLDA